MQHLELTPTAMATATADRPPAARRLLLIIVGMCVAALLATLAAVLVQLNFVGQPFAPTADDGHISDDTVVTLADDIPAISRLNPALLAAMRQAEADAAAQGVPAFRVTSGWRSEPYQRWLLDDAIERYGSEEIARQYVATPDRSQHVTGDAIDIVPLDAQLWLIQHGAAYGICQTYANERWHFELATTPGGVCPEMKADAAS